MKEPHEASSFKLFGRTIQLASAAGSSGNTISTRPIIETSVQESPIREDAIESEQDTEPSSSHSNNDGNEPSSSKSESEKQDEETETGKEEEEPNGSRPVIIRWLSCPRCESSDTKFCYFNNYNVNQPRHFCRKCQRYWTNGGNQRNLPVGSGRRKRKTKRDNNSKDQILNSLYGSSSSTSSVPPFVMSSSVNYGANNLDLHGLNGLLVWSNSRIPP